MSSYRHILFIIAICLLCCSCVPRGIRKAQCVVAQADSLWKEGKMYGVDMGDSATLAQAYETLGKISKLSIINHQSSIYYAHSCYHYGRLLRAKDNPVEAMQVFIDATHSRTRDYHILGRIYSNMGDIAHLASEFSLAYDMYERSGEMYLRNGDTLLYYYDLNNMAFELAEQGKEEETLAILEPVERQCADRDVLAKTYETKARLYFNTAQFDSAIICTRVLPNLGYEDPLGYVIRAQSFDTLGIIDSAMHYAKKVLLLPTATIQDKYNMLYITTHYNPAIDTKELLYLTSQRADLGMSMDNQHAKHTQASEILRQELRKGTNVQGWFILIMSILLLFVVSMIPHMIKKHKHLISSLSDKQTQNTIESIQRHIDATDLNQTLHWKDYESMKTDVDLYMNSLVSKLESYHLNETYIRFCVLTLLEFSLKEIANTLYYSYPSGIKTLKKRVANKLGTTPPKLKDFLLHL